jgi:hypothetical protein
MIRFTSALCFLCAFAVTASGAPQPIPGVDIIAKRQCTGCPFPPHKLAFVGASGSGGVQIPNNFFFPGFSGDALWPAPHLEGLDSPSFPALTMERYTAPDSFNGIDTKMLSMSLASETPLVIDATHSYNWTVSVTSSAMGKMTLGNETSLGGQVISSFFNVSYSMQFNRIETSEAPLTLNGTDLFHFSGQPYWSSVFPGGMSIPNGNNFALGTDGTAITGFQLIGDSGAWDLNFAPVPEPHSAALTLLGMIIAFATRNRQFRASQS